MAGRRKNANAAAANAEAANAEAANVNRRATQRARAGDAANAAAGSPVDMPPISYDPKTGRTILDLSDKTSEGVAWIVIDLVDCNREEIEERSGKLIENNKIVVIHPSILGLLVCPEFYSRAFLTHGSDTGLITNVDTGSFYIRSYGAWLKDFKFIDAVANPFDITTEIILNVAGATGETRDEIIKKMFTGTTTLSSETIDGKNFDKEAIQKIVGGKLPKGRGGGNPGAGFKALFFQ